MTLCLNVTLVIWNYPKKWLAANFIGVNFQYIAKNPVPSTCYTVRRNFFVAFEKLSAIENYV